MPRPTRRSPFLAAAGLSAAAAFALWAASPDAPGQPPGESQGAGGPFAVAGGATPVLLDTATGDAWALARLGPGEHAWLPCERVTDPARAAELRGRLRGDGAANANGGGPAAASAEPAGGAYFPRHLLGGDLIHGDLIGGDLVGGSLVGEALIGGAVVDGDLLGGQVMGPSEQGGGESGGAAGGSD